MQVHFKKYLAVLTMGLIFSGVTSRATAQSRLSDKDVEHLIGNLHSDVKAFRSPLESALKKSSIRKTSQEKDAKDLAKQLEKQTGDMLDTFKHNQKADDAFRSVNNTYQQLDSIVRQLGPQSSAVPSWSKVQADLTALNPAFGVTPVAAKPAAVSDIPCVQAVGEQRSGHLVDECRQVSTATSGPCNAQNACKLIVDEIRRGCSRMTYNAPSFCAEYK